MDLLNKIYNLSRMLYEEYEVYTKFYFETDSSLVIKIDTLNGDRYSFSYEYITYRNEDEITNWLDSIHEQFREMLIDKALGRSRV